MKKEHMQVLHDELIKIDLIKYSKRDVISSFFALLLSSPFVVPVFYFLSLERLERAEILTLILCLIVSPLCITFLIATIYYIKKHIDISRDKFKVVTDTLITAADNTDNFSNFIRTSGPFNIVYSLHFGRFKPFPFLKRDIFYKWSKAYKMDGYSLLNSSASGDKFYIVTLNGKTPIMVYNAKMFDYKEEQE